MPSTEQNSNKNDADWLQPYRERIDNLDNQIIDLLGKRFDVVREVGILKTEQNIKIEQSNRVEEVKQRNGQRAAKHHIDPTVIHHIYDILIDYAHTMEYDIQKNIQDKTKEC